MHAPPAYTLFNVRSSGPRSFKVYSFGLLSPGMRLPPGLVRLSTLHKVPKSSNLQNHNECHLHIFQRTDLTIEAGDYLTLTPLHRTE